MLNPHSPVRRGRAEIRRKAAFSALVAATVFLLALKMLLGLAFAGAAVVAVLAFVLVFGLLLRLSPKDEP